MGGSGGYGEQFRNTLAQAAANARPPPPADLSDEAVRNALASERARLLAGNSRRAAFQVGSATDSTAARSSILGT